MKVLLPSVAQVTQSFLTQEQFGGVVPDPTGQISFLGHETVLPVRAAIDAAGVSWLAQVFLNYLAKFLQSVRASC